MMRLAVFAAAVGSVVALVGSAEAANTSAAIDPVRLTPTEGCFEQGQRDCPQSEMTIGSARMINVIEPGELAMLIMGVGAMLLAGRGR
jgi:hypothetical protein